MVRGGRAVLSCGWIGKGEIVVIDKANVAIKMGAKLQNVHTDRVRVFC
jgi:hypothetical protein